MTYVGDISTLRLEMVKADESLAGPYWFVSDQAMKFVTADGSAIETNVIDETTIVIDLEASGINIGDCTGMHMYFHGPDTQEAIFAIKDARFTTAEATDDATEATDDAEATDDVETTDDATEATADDVATKTDSLTVPIVVGACLVVLCVGAVLVFSKKNKAAK